jgi:Flp pilus assembly CpaF family ATPase
MRVNDSERRDLEQYVAEHVADGIVRYGAAGMSEAERRSFVEKLAREAIDEVARTMVQGAVTIPTADEEEQIVRRIVATQLGLGRLQLLLDEDDIENININGCDSVWVKRADGTKEQVEPIADCDEDLVELVQRAARAHHTGGERRIDSAKPIVDVHLAGGHRLSAMIEVSNRPCVSIRRHRLVDPTLSDLADSMTDELARFLRAAVRARLNMIVSGGTDAGKTTLLRALAAEADPSDRIVTIELSYELGLHELAHRHPDCVAWETREANTEGQGAVSMDYLVQRANRHDADRVIVGEVLGDEIVPMLNAMTAGKAGSMCTIHADSTEGTFGKIKTYASQSPKHLTDNAAAQLTAQALDLVIFVRKRPDASGLARRYVSSVRVVEDSDQSHVISTEIFAEPDGGGPAVHHLGMPPGLRDRLADFGYEAPLVVYGR